MHSNQLYKYLLCFDEHDSYPLCFVELGDKNYSNPLIPKTKCSSSQTTVNALNLAPNQIVSPRAAYDLRARPEPCHPERSARERSAQSKDLCIGLVVEQPPVVEQALV